MVGQEDSMIQCFKNNSIVPSISPVLFLYHFKSITVIKARQNEGYHSPVYKAADGTDARDRLEFYHSAKSLSDTYNYVDDNAQIREPSKIVSSIMTPKFRAVSSNLYRNPIQIGMFYSSKWNELTTNVVNVKY